MADGTSRAIRFGSVCSGIEAATVAWGPLGWKAAWLSEIEPFPCAVLAHHYPDTPNHGDMTTLVRRILQGEVEAPDVFTGGTPCQAFSVAGKRQSLDDARGNLSLTFVEIANAIDHVRAARGDDECIVVWENVPGVLSTRDNAFGCFLGALAGAGCELQPAGGKWTDAGCVYGPQRAVAWRVLDAQYFGLAQRRRRVFVVASARNGFDPAAVLFERDSVRRDSPPRREAREAAPTTPSRSTAGGGLGTDFDLDGGVVQWPAEIASTLNASFGDKQGLENQHLNGGGRCSFLPLISMCLNAGAMGRQDAESETLIPTFGGGFDVAHTLKAEGFDASEDGTGRGTPLVPVSVALRGRNEGATAELGDDVAFALRASGGGGDKPHVLAFSCKDHGADAGDVAPTLRSMGHDGSHANGGGQVAVAFHPTQDPISSTDGTTHCLGTGSSGGTATVAVAFAIQAGATRTNPDSGPDGVGAQADHAYTLEARAEVQAVAFDTTQITSPANYSNPRPGDPCHPLAVGAHPPALATSMAVRRLTPRECERLMGFGDDYTAIPWRGKPADQCPDGPRYKALGNSWAVPCVRWIGVRINQLIQARTAA